MKLLDRLTGEQVDAEFVARTRLHLGRWTRVDSPSAWILTEPDATWRLPLETPAEDVVGEGFPHAWPEGAVEDALRTLGDQLDELHELDATWHDWTQQCPIPKNLAQSLEPEPLEEALSEELHRLEAVCRAPHTHIELHTERVALGRARKLDRRAPQHLATHSEDWAARRISGVIPRRLLALVREPQWDLYENRVAARLVDHLVVWLRRRVRILRQIQSEILAELDTEAASHGSYQRRRRLYGVWGDSWDNDKLGATLRTALADAERYLYRALGLMSSPLYRQVPRGAQVELRLRDTNLLHHEDDYRGAARLWRAWAKATRPRPLSPHEQEARARALSTAFESWCVLLVIRACSQLHLCPHTEQQELRIERGCRLDLGAGLELWWTEEGTIRIHEHNRLRVEFVPLLQVLERNDGAPIPARVQPLFDAVERHAQGGWRVILHPGVAPESAIARVHAPPLPEQVGVLDFVRVSPLALDGVERVARVLRWATLVPKMLAYPPRVEIPPERAHDWPLEAAEDGWTLTTPIETQHLLALGRELDTARARLARLEAEHLRVSDAARAAHGDARARSKLNREKKQLSAQVNTERVGVADLEALRENLERGAAAINELLRCPVCAARCDFQARARACFRSRCSSEDCHALLELRLDPGTGERVPVLLLESAKDLAWGPEASATKAARLVGADLLSLPYARPDGSLGFSLSAPPRALDLG